MKKLQDFYEEVLKSDELKKEFLNCKKEEEIASFLKKYDCDAKVDELKKFIEEKFTKEGKVDAEEIEKISAGKQACGLYLVDITMSICTLLVGCVGVTITSLIAKEHDVGGNLEYDDCSLCHPVHKN